MIDKLVGELAQNLVDFFSTYDINVSAQYTPNLNSILSYSKNFLARNMSTSQVNIDGSIYLNKLLYSIGTPKLAHRLPQNMNLTVALGFENLSQKYIISPWDKNGLSKIRLDKFDKNNQNGNVITRDISLLDIPVEFCIITESKDLTFAIALLFYQQILRLDGCELNLDLLNDGTLTKINYFLLWDRESLEIDYANFESQNALNTIKFKGSVSGIIFSGFNKDTKIVNYIDLKIGINDNEENNESVNNKY